MNLVIGVILALSSCWRRSSSSRAWTRLAAARWSRHGGGVLGLMGAALLLLRGRFGVAATLAGVAASFAGWRTIGGQWTRSALPAAGAGARPGASRPRARR